MGLSHFGLRVWGFRVQGIRDPFLRCPHNGDHNSLGAILGSPYLETVIWDILKNALREGGRKTFVPWGPACLRRYKPRAC